mgnify:CR=1 FL=1
MPSSSVKNAALYITMKKVNLFVLLIAGLLALWFFASRGTHASAPARPNDPWVFRSVIDKQPRMITFALHNNMWVSYSTDSCSLYKAWPGGVDFTGAVYNMRHGPQPMTIGAAWMESKSRQPWQVSVGGKTETPRTDYKGHRYLKDGSAEIMYDLVLADGAQAIFKRGDFLFSGKAGDLPDETKINQIVYFADDSTIQATAPGAPNLGGILRAITEGSYVVAVS